MGPFITIAELTDKLGESAATARGTAVIAAACDMVRTFTEQVLSPVGTATISLDGTGTDALLLPERPVISAGTVVEQGGTLTIDTDYVLNNNGVLFRKPGTIDDGWSDDVVKTYWWPGRQNIEVTYSYGYSSVPADLKEVALTMAARFFRQTDPDISFESLGAYSRRYSEGAGGFNGTERIILRKYKMAR